ncbi:DUF1851 domain-containing protein [Hydrogenophaga taeniospiralis]|uniref:DUF1851 domain-containing protein n=1 Tax=Hydrogenophaga taeniospiralis TaxID=65656 RepID=UPI001CFAB8FE|nr:DUF1851 domain-containing protein [Hydrogenophaga taeniospiralis]MCB4362704.1 DUF1851 domain-containing protein [Hydrogenophaga taeniospiralis]
MSYFLLQPPRPTSALGCWESQLPAFTHVIGYSGLGHFFLFDQRKNEYAVLYPFRQAYKSYGSFVSLEAFESEVLEDVGFSEYVLKPGHQAAIQERLGPLGAEEVYIPEPYPFLGGTEEPDTYSKGNFWVFAELVGMSHGFA